jgi:hypothetical protein
MYDYNDFKTNSVPRRKTISNANNDIYPVTGGSNNGIINHTHSP